MTAGNEIWWNGGDGSGTIGLKGYSGSYLTATSTYFSNQGTPDQQEAIAAEYGIFSSNSEGPGQWNQLYASNFNDSGMYVGACHQLCDVTIDHAWMEYNALGYSGTNSGGALVIENSQFDNNQDGVDTNTQINGDPPAPQNGACPNNGISPITHTHSCWVFIHNDSHNNNNPNVPEAGQCRRRADRDRHDPLGWPERHGDGQHLLRQRRVGVPAGSLPRLGDSVAQPELPGHRGRGRRLASAVSTTR